MQNKLFTGFIALLFLSCSEENVNENWNIKTGKGEIWRSGGLYFCAEQIRIQNGDTLIPVNEEKIIAFQSGQKVRVKYRELDNRETGCNIGKDCEIIEIEIIE